MIEISEICQLEDYQLRELETNNLFINKYGTDLKYLYELNVYWKEFLFDMLQEITSTDSLCLVKQNNLLEELKKYYKMYIKLFNLKIDIKDYVDLNDYITLKEWSELTGHFLVKNGANFYLIVIK
jgi:hypothetical protein